MQKMHRKTTSRAWVSRISPKVHSTWLKLYFFNDDLILLTYVFGLARTTLMNAIPTIRIGKMAETVSRKSG